MNEFITPKNETINQAERSEQDAITKEIRKAVDGGLSNANLLIKEIGQLREDSRLNSDDNISKLDEYHEETMLCIKEYGDIWVGDCSELRNKFLASRMVADTEASSSERQQFLEDAKELQQRIKESLDRINERLAKVRDTVVEAKRMLEEKNKADNS